jgi:two-component system OmpR family sensor kinase
MSERRGLPIAAHLALLVALAFAAAFVVNIAVVIWLPPRPPDVMRGDHLIEEFARGFDEARATNHVPRSEIMRWRIADRPINAEPSPAGHMLAPQLAERIGVAPDHVHIAAHAAQSEMFVYRVRNFEHPGDVSDRVAPPGRQGDVIFSRDVTIITRPGMQGPVPPAPPLPPEPPLFAPPPPGVVLISGFEIAAELPSGQWLVMRQGRNWEELGWIARAALVIGATLLVLSVLALAFARRLARPIQSFAQAVQAVGVDPQSAAIDERGPRELRGAARAVNAMQARLRALVADRTQTLATVAHDMRTPLMRLRLAAEDVEPAQRERIAKEIGDVEALVSSFIAFARDDPAEEPRVRIDLAALLQSLVDDEAAAGRDVSFAGEDRFVITGQSLGLKRLFANLIDNAVKYGASARVTLARTENMAIIEIADDGPGVPLDQRDAVFRPFVRLGAAAGGAGLGLPAARSIARAHGGEIAFMDATRGALVRVTLPV